jgi:MFS family permease
VIFAPIAGALVDRWDRRKVMIMADAGAGVSTLFITLLFFSNRLELWQIYLAAGISSFFGTFQWPAYTATVTQLVPKAQLGRANGMIQFGRAAAEILAPLLAGVLVLSIQLQGVILIDVITFIFALLTLLIVRFPRVDAAPPTHNKLATFKIDLTFGWKYILARRGLLYLLFFLAVVNFIWGTIGALVVPMILSFSTSDRLGAIITIAGTGMFTGSLLMTAWGGPKRRIHGVLFFELLSGFCFMLMGFRPAFWLIGFGAFGAHLTIAIVFGSNQALWQTKVKSKNQGRVFATQLMITSIATPLAYLLAGPIAEKIFEPWMTSGSTLSQQLGLLIGVGPGRGIGLMFFLMGLAKVAVSIIGYLNPRVRLIEDELPDAISNQ